MRLYTLGINYFHDYILPMTITDDLSVLREKDAENYYKVLYVKTGTLHFVLDQEEYVLTGAHAICLNDVDNITFYDTPETSVWVIIFQPSVVNVAFKIDVINNMNPALSLTQFQDLFYLNQFMHKAPVNIKILPLRAHDSDMIEYKLKKIKYELEGQDNISWPCRSRSYLFEILFCLVRQEEEPVKSIQPFDGRSKLAADIIYYLQSSYSQKITIEHLAGEFHTNRTSLLTEFKKHTGQSINRYLVQMRLGMASTLLRDTQLSLEEIAERTGFSDISYFSKVFKKEIKITPSEYRRINN
ncbi:MAG TPA: AraC family transcriptional regulator [Mobilitalea sp.]|nr:AraC family transcriptional regulator [Mobilitalea sp.]